MDQFYENIVFIPCSAMVCFGTLPFFLCHKRLHCYIPILNSQDCVA